jgi:hypothetical protein
MNTQHRWIPASIAGLCEQVRQYADRGNHQNDDGKLSPGGALLSVQRSHDLAGAMRADRRSLVDTRPTGGAFKRCGLHPKGEDNEHDQESKTFHSNSMITGEFLSWQLTQPH